MKPAGDRDYGTVLWNGCVGKAGFWLSNLSSRNYAEDSVEEESETNEDESEEDDDDGEEEEEEGYEVAGLKCTLYWNERARGLPWGIGQVPILLV